MGTTYIERHVYDAGGHTGSTFYIRIVQRGDSRIWNPNTKLMKVVGDITWDDSIILLVEQGSTGVFPITFTHDWRTLEDVARELYDKRFIDLTDVEKAAVGTEHQAISNIPADTYDVIVYKQLGSTPANTDDIEKQFEMKVGGIFGF